MPAPSTEKVLTPSQGWPSTGYAWYVVGVLTLAQTLSFVDRQIIALLIGPLKLDFNLTDVEISLLGGPAFAIFYTLMGIPIGRLIDHTSRTRVIACGVFLWSLATMACGLAKGFWSLFLARVGVGVGEGTLSPGAFSIIADYFPPDKLTRPLALYLTGVWFGTGLAFILGGAVIGLVADMGQITLPILGDVKTWQVVFFAVGAPGLLFPLLMLTVREPARRSKIAADRNGVALATALEHVWAHRRTYMPIFLSLGFFAAYGLGTSFWTIEFFSRQFGADRAETSFIYGVICFVCGTAGSMSAGWLADRLEQRGIRDAKVLVAALGMTLMLPFAILFPQMPSFALAMIGVAGVVFCTPFPYGPAVAALQNVTPNELRGLVSGLYLFVAVILGLGMGPTVIALFTDYLFKGDDLLPASLTATGVLLVPASVVSMWLARKPYQRSLADSAAWSER